QEPLGKLRLEAGLAGPAGVTRAEQGYAANGGPLDGGDHIQRQERQRQDRAGRSQHRTPLAPQQGARGAGGVRRVVPAAVPAGRTTGDLKVIAQFDKAGTSIIDFTGEINYGNCAPEQVPPVTTDCPSDLATGHQVPLVGDIIQIPPGGRVKLADGSILVIQADTAVTGGASGNPPLADTGVPFAFID